MNEICREIRELLPELALGVLGGEERARVLDHLTTCAECSAELATLSRVADGVLELAPQEEPSVGFEDRVLARLKRERPRHRTRMIVSLIAAAAAIAALAAGGMYVRTAKDRNLAAYYRNTLAVAHGSEFTVALLQTQDGFPAGEIFVYEGKPSWVFAVVRAPVADGIYTITGTGNGTERRIGRVHVEHGSGDWGGTTTAGVTRLTVIRIVSADGRDALEARFSHR
jgi:hypothetical protein